MRECGKDVFPDHPEWDVKCNLQWTHAGTCARFDSVPISEESAVAMEIEDE